MFPAYTHLSAYDRHKKIINDYFQLKGGSALNLKRDTSRDKTDYDVIKENHKFLWDEEKDIPNTWEARLAKKYYDKLFKEYCICDLTYFRLDKIALRWRTEKEVIVGKGQFICADKECSAKDNLTSWEMNFGYFERGQKKNALVKLRLCRRCSGFLNFRSRKRESKRNKALKRLGITPEQSHPSASSSTDNSKVTIKEGKDEENQDHKDHQEESTEDNNIEESEIWKRKPVETVEKSREEEFEEYLADLLL